MSFHYIVLKGEVWDTVLLMLQNKAPCVPGRYIMKKLRALAGLQLSAYLCWEAEALSWRGTRRRWAAAAGTPGSPASCPDTGRTWLTAACGPWRKRRREKGGVHGNIFQPSIKISSRFYLLQSILGSNTWLIRLHLLWLSLSLPNSMPVLPGKTIFYTVQGGILLVWAINRIPTPHRLQSTAYSITAQMNHFSKAVADCERPLI